MEAKLLSRLRPADDTAAEIAAALDRISAERRALEARAPALKQDRAVALVRGTPQDVMTAEARAREHEIALEQLDLLSDELAPHLAAARATEAHAELKRRAAEVAETVASAATWWTDRYPDLAAQIVAGLELCRAAENETSQLLHAVQVAYRDPAVAALGSIMPDGGSDLPRTAIYGTGQVTPCVAVQLPPGPDDGKAPWWPQTLAGRPRPPGF